MNLFVKMTPFLCPPSCNRMQALSSLRNPAAIMVSERELIPKDNCSNFTASPIAWGFIYQCPNCAALNLTLHYDDLTLTKFPLTSSERKLVIDFCCKRSQKALLRMKLVFLHHIILKFIDIRKKDLVQNQDKGPLRNINFTLRHIQFELREKCPPIPLL